MRRFLLLLGAACGSTSTPTPATQAGGPPAPLTATPAGASDVQVARVNGRPVYASCLQAQAARGASKQDALQQCIDFELLAQRAEEYATDPEVVHATRTALVSTFVAREYEAKFQQPADFGGYWDKIIERNKRQLQHPEARASAYIRIPVAAGAPATDDATAKAIADELVATIRKERGLMAQHLEPLAQQLIGTRAKFEVAAVPHYTNEGGLVDDYAKPLFAIKEVGTSYPAAVRTQWGWDVIVLTDLIPAANPTPDELVKTALPDVKRVFFPAWVLQLAQRAGTVTKIYDDNVPALENL